MVRNTIKTRIIGFALATHLGPTLAVSTIATTLGLQAGLGPMAPVLFVVAFTGQCSVGWSNDAADAGLDALAKRVEKPTVQGAVSPTQLWYAASIAAVISIGLSWLLTWQSALLYGVALGSAWIYNLALKATWASFVPYAVSFGLLPAIVTVAGSPSHWPPRSVMLGAVLLGVGAHFINTLKDVSHDHTTGVRGLPQMMGPGLSLWVGVACTAMSLSLFFLAAHVSSWALMVMIAGALGLVAVVTTALLKAHHWAWRLIIGEALLCVVMMVVSGTTLRH